MKNILLFFSLCVVVCNARSQSSALGKTYIFDNYDRITPCDAFGKVEPGAAGIAALKGTVFNVVYITKGDTPKFVIEFWKFNDPDLIKTYNYKVAEPEPGSVKSVREKRAKGPSVGAETFDMVISPSRTCAGEKITGEVRYFLLDPLVLAEKCTEYKGKFATRYQLAIGTLTTPFKIRNHPALFTNNINVGTCIMLQKRLYQNFSVGLVGGISLTSVSLDSFSTKGIVETTTDRPALTPSLHLMAGYKSFNITAGIGWDHINRRSGIEKSWRYQGRRWFGIGIGVSLFNKNDGNETATATATKQKAN